MNPVGTSGIVLLVNFVSFCSFYICFGAKIVSFEFLLYTLSYIRLYPCRVCFKGPRTCLEVRPIRSDKTRSVRCQIGWHNTNCWPYLLVRCKCGYLKKSRDSQWKENNKNFMFLLISRFTISTKKIFYILDLAGDSSAYLWNAEISRWWWWFTKWNKWAQPVFQLWDIISFGNTLVLNRALI